MDVTADPANCGACGMICAVGQGCVNGVCTCPAGQVPCDGVCVDTWTNAMNCGTCGNACPAGTPCSAGTCVTGTGGAGTGGTPGSGGAITGSGGDIIGSGGATTGSGGAITGSGGAVTGIGGDTGSGGETGSGGDPGTAGETGSGGDPSSCTPTWDPPDSANGNTNLPAGLDAVWEHTGSTIMAADNIKIRQIMAHEGIMRYCIRWDSTETINATQRGQIEALLAVCERQWIDQLSGWGCWPYPEVDVQVTLWAARDRAFLDWPDGDTPAQIVVNPSAECPSDCGPWSPRNDHASCSTALYDEFFWLDGSVTEFTGWGSATGFMMGASSFLDAASRNPDTHVILAHEMGHSHGLDDFYDWQPEGWSSWIMWAGTAQYVTETDGWMVRDVWRHVRSDYGYPGP